MGVDFRVLGPFEVVDPQGCRIDLGAPRQRAVLAVLLIHVNQVVSVDRLIDELWGDAPPAAASASLQAYVSNLRRVLEPERPPRTPATLVVTEAPGYVLRISPEQVDAVRFEQLAADGRRALAAGDAVAALDRFDAAFRLWRGDAFADFAYESFAGPQINRLHELRAGVEEDRVEARLVGGDLAGAATALGRLVRQYPLRERLRALQMRVLYSAGRQAEALRAYDEARALLADELGIQPGPELQRLHRQVLDQDPALDPRAPATPSPATEDPPSDAAATSLRSTFVGRDSALNRLVAALDTAEEGQTTLLLVEGDPGIGKSRLAEELSTRARERNFLTLWGHCHDDEGSPPLWPWVQILRSLVAGDSESPPGAAPPDPIIARLPGGRSVDQDIRTYSSASPELPEHVRSVLAALLPELGPAIHNGLTPEAARFRLFDAVRETISRRAADRPLVVVVDDLQWADATSLRLLRFLAVELREAPLVVIATFRSTEVKDATGLRDALADTARSPNVERLVLHGLTEPDVADLLRLTTNLEADEMHTVAATLHERTDGNPFFLTELIRLMQSERRLNATDAAADIPVAVGDVVRRRIQRLPEELQTVLGTAAAVGREFDLDVLADACGLEPDRALELLETALVTRIVVEHAPGRYRFTHALVNETLYGDLAPAPRTRVHGRIAEAMERVWRADLPTHYSELAHHYCNAPASAADRAVTFSRLAGEQACGRSAYDEAVHHFRMAEAALDRLRDATAERRSRLLLELATATRRTGDLAGAARVHEEALAVARSLEDPTMIAEVALAYGEIDLWQVRDYGSVDDSLVNAISEALDVLDVGDSELRTRLLIALAVAVYFRDADTEHSRSLARDAVAMARRLGDPALVAASLVELIVMLDTEPDQTEQLAAAVAFRSLEPGTVPRETLSAAHCRLARVALASGDASALDREIDEFNRRARAARHVDEQLWGTWAGVGVAFLRDRLDEAERLAGEGLELHRRLGIWGAEETFVLHMVFIWREQQRMREVSPLVEPLLAQWVHPNASKIRALFALEQGAVQEVAELLGSHPLPRLRDFTWLTDACITAELAAAARLPCRTQLYEMLLPFEQRVSTMDGTFVCLGAVSYYLGLLAESLARGDEAARLFDHAVTLNTRVGAVPWARRARTRLNDVLTAAASWQ